MLQTAGSFLNEYNYGLIPTRGTDGKNFKLLTEISQQTLNFRLQHCTAITRGGYLIDFPGSSDNDDAAQLQLELSISLQELKDKASTYFLLLRVDPNQCISGDVNNSKYLPLTPCPFQALSLGVISEEEIARSPTEHLQLPLARIHIEQQGVVLDENYIPPCISMSSHADLLQLHGELGEFFSIIELSASKICQAILQKKPQNVLAPVIQKLCENLIVLTASYVHDFRSLDLHQPPVHTLNKVKSVAYLFKSILNLYAGSGRDETINYINEWCDLKPGQLENSIEELSKDVYSHFDINNSIQKVVVFTKVFSRLFQTLARMEFIGKRKELSVFVTEPTEVLQPARKRRWFGLDVGKSSQPNESQPNKSVRDAHVEPEPVYLGVSAPESVRPGTEFTARFVAYVKSLEQEVQTKLWQMSSRSKTSLGLEQCRWQKDTKVKVKLYGTHLSIDPSEQFFSWNGECNILNFDVKVSLTAPATTTVLKFDVYVSEFKIAMLRLDLEISDAEKKSTFRTVKGQPIETAFASYASQDRERVLDRLSEIRRTGIDVYLDCLSMRPGEEWKPALEREIQTREGFFLFWSAHAKNSKWVTWEWRTALMYKGIDKIDPHPLVPVSDAEPPDELKNLHFGDVYMIVREASNRKKFFE